MVRFHHAVLKTERDANAIRAYLDEAFPEKDNTP